MLIYDGDCGFCRRSLGWARRLGATCDMQPAAAVDLAAYGLTADDALAAAWYVEPDGRLYRGHAAVARALESSRRGPVRLLGRLVGSRAVSPLAGRVYAWVAGNRHRLPGGEVCRVEPDDLSGRGRRGGDGAGADGPGRA